MRICMSIRLRICYMVSTYYVTVRYLTLLNKYAALFVTGGYLSYYVTVLYYYLLVALYPNRYIMVRVLNTLFQCVSFSYSIHEDIWVLYLCDGQAVDVWSGSCLIV